MTNKFAAWKDRQKPKITTNQIAAILGVRPGWVSTLLNQPDESRYRRPGERRCSYDLALKIQFMTGGDVNIEEMMTSPSDYKRIRSEVRRRYKKYVKS